MIKMFIACLLLAASAPILAGEKLPRVLVVGDSVYNEIASTAGREHKGRIQFVWKAPSDSGTTLLRVGDLLGDGNWEVIHFNFGSADLHYKDPATKSVRAMSKHAGGVRVTTAEQYEKNLNELVKRFQATGAKLIWASTMPIVSSKSDNIYDPGSEIEFNAIAARVMTAHKIPINDMHAYVLANSIPRAKNDKGPGKAQSLSAPVVSSVLSALNLQGRVK